MELDRTDNLAMLTFLFIRDDSNNQQKYIPGANMAVLFSEVITSFEKKLRLDDLRVSIES
jgi:hypothetical protein